MPELLVSKRLYDEMVAHCLEAHPFEGCGLLGMKAGENEVVAIYPTANAARSAKVYTVDAMDHLRADREAASEGLEIGGVFHSHTHTEAYPSPTDVEQAPDPGWHYVIVSLATPDPDVRSFRIVNGKIEPESLVVDI